MPVINAVLSVITESTMQLGRAHRSTSRMMACCAARTGLG